MSEKKSKLYLEIHKTSSHPWEAIKKICDIIEVLQKWNPQIERNMEHAQHHTTEILMLKKDIQEILEILLILADPDMGKNIKYDRVKEKIAPNKGVKCHTCGFGTPDLKDGLCPNCRKQRQIDYEACIHDLTTIITKCQETIINKSVITYDVNHVIRVDILKNLINNWKNNTEKGQYNGYPCEKCKSRNTEYRGSYDSVNDWIMDKYKCNTCGHEFSVGEKYE